MTTEDLGPDSTDAVDLHPERCAFTWARDGARRIRCTARADDQGHAHHWDRDEYCDWLNVPRRRFSAPPAPSEHQIDAAVAAFHAALTDQGIGWTDPDDWRDEVAAALRAGLGA